MLFTRLIVKNLYSFDNLDIDFTLRNKSKEEILENEFLENRPNFLIKRVCVFAGANATGKTSIGRIMCAMKNFLVIPRKLNPLVKSITDKSKTATVEFEFVTTEDHKLHRCHIELTSQNQSIPLEVLNMPVLILHQPIASNRLEKNWIDDLVTMNQES